MMRRLDKYWYRVLGVVHGWGVRRARAHWRRERLRRLEQQVAGQRRHQESMQELARLAIAVVQVVAAPVGRAPLIAALLGRAAWCAAPDPSPSLPPMIEGEPAPGKLVKQQSEEFRGSGVYHALCLPTDWQPGRGYPVIVEYAPNKWAHLTGKVEDCRLGFCQSGGSHFLWVVMPYVHPVGKTNVVWWWGDEQATTDYCRTNLGRICERYGGDPNAIFLTGFSRGAIACSYLGLRDEMVAELWLAFLPHSHIDGGRFTTPGARERLARTRGRPTFITYGSDDDGKNESPKGARLLRALGFDRHGRPLRDSFPYGWPPRLGGPETGFPHRTRPAGNRH